MTLLGNIVKMLKLVQKIPGCRRAGWRWGHVVRLRLSNQLPGAPTAAGPQSQGLVEPDPWLPRWTLQPRHPVPRAHRPPPPRAADSDRSPRPEHLQRHQPPKGMSCVTLGKFLLSLFTHRQNQGRPRKWEREERVEGRGERKGQGGGEGKDGQGKRGGQSKRGQQLRDFEDKGVSLRKQE